jgi:ketosteroid isomerase-like protein
MAMLPSPTAAATRACTRAPRWRRAGASLRGFLYRDESADKEEAMPSIGQENLETVMIDFLGALRRGDFDAAAALLEPDVNWQGLCEEWVCRGREEVIDTFRWGLEERREIDALEFTRGGDRVVMGARGPSITEVGDEPLEGQIFNVFTLRDGRIVRIEDFRERSEALAAAGVSEDVGWR